MSKKNNNTPTQNASENDIELSHIQTQDDVQRLEESYDLNEFGVFHDIHYYFHDKYRRDFDHSDFYSRAKDFFQSLMLVLKGKKNQADFPYHSKKYVAYYTPLFSQNLSNDSIINYFNVLLRKTQSTKGKEQLFYQRYVVRVALPILSISTGISKNTFTQIVEGVPPEMLYAEQQMFFDKENGSINEYSGWWTTLSESAHPDAITRFCQVAKRMPSGHKVSDVCSMSVEILEKIAQKNDIFAGIYLGSMYMSTVIIVLRKLLLSPREDRKLAINIVQNQLNNKVLMINLFCSTFFWKKLTEKPELSSVIDASEIFSLFISMHGKKRKNRQLHKMLNEIFLTPNRFETRYSPCLEIRNISAQACAIFFVLSYTYYAVDSVIRDNLKNILKECEKSHDPFDTRKIKLIKFLLKDSARDRQNLLRTFIGNIQNGNVKEEDADLVNQYIVAKQKFYGEDQYLSQILRVLKPADSLTGSSRLSQGLYNKTPEGSRASATTSSSVSSPASPMSK